MFYELEQTINRSWVLCPKFQGIKRAHDKQLLLKRLNSFNERTIELPGRLLKVKTIKIEIDGRLIDVEGVCKQAWDYILYQPIYYEDEYYVDIVLEQRFTSWSKDFKLTGTQTASLGTGEEITAMIQKKRRK